MRNIKGIANFLEFKFTYTQFVCEEKHLRFSVAEALKCSGHYNLQRCALNLSMALIVLNPFGFQVFCGISTVLDRQFKRNLATGAKT